MAEVTLKDLVGVVREKKLHEKHGIATDELDAIANKNFDAVLYEKFLNLLVKEKKEFPQNMQLEIQESVEPSLSAIRQIESYDKGLGRDIINQQLELLKGMTKNELGQAAADAKNVLDTANALTRGAEQGHVTVDEAKQFLDAAADNIKGDVGNHARESAKKIQAIIEKGAQQNRGGRGKLN